MPVLRSLSAVLIIILWTGAVSPTGAQSPRMRSVADPGGRFTISFPSAWRVVTPESGLPAVAGLAPDAPGGFHVNVNVIVENLSTAVSPKGYAALSEPAMRAMFHEFTVIDQGAAKVARRSAYYRYFTWKPNVGDVLYQVQAYFTIGRRGFVLTGTTVNDPDRIRQDFTVISQIFETFKPASSRSPAEASGSARAP